MFKSRNSFVNLVGFEDYEVYLVVLYFDWEINELFIFILIIFYINGDYNWFDDDDEGLEGFDLFWGRFVYDMNWVEELCLSFENDWFVGVVGGYYI